jgi:hypothetical protein
MGTLRRPDWTEPMGTGLWGLGYRLRDNQGFVLLSNDAGLLSEDPDRLWPFILTQDQQRNKLVEQSIARHESFSSLLEHQRLGKDDILCVREKHLNELLDLLAKQPLQQGASSRRRSSVEDGRRVDQEPFEVSKDS